MKEVLFALPGVALTILCWGSYGPILHRGQANLGSDRLKPLICVGLAYFVVAIIIPTVVLTMRGNLGGSWTARGITWSMGAGTAGAIGALGIILALTSGGKPIYVMPLVFGGAPIINVLVAMRMAGVSTEDMGARFPLFLAGVIMVAVGGAIVMTCAPKGGKKEHVPPAEVHAPATPGEQQIGQLPEETEQDEEPA